MARLKLNEIKDIVLELELPDGTVKSYDPWELSERFRALALAEADKPKFADRLSEFDIVRKAMDFPLQAEVDAATPKPFTLSRNQTVEMQKEVAVLTQECGAAKKLKELSQN